MTSCGSSWAWPRPRDRSVPLLERCPEPDAEALTVPHQELCVTVTLIAAVLAEDRQGVVAELDCVLDPGHDALLG